jgi:hypothetical protein
VIFVAVSELQATVEAVRSGSVLEGNVNQRNLPPFFVSIKFPLTFIGRLEEHCTGTVLTPRVLLSRVRIWFACLFSLYVFHFPRFYLFPNVFISPVTVAERSNACTVFARSESGIVGSNPTQGMYVWYVYVFILCLCCPVFR